MARVPIEVIMIGDAYEAEVSSAIALANTEQGEFLFSSVEGEFQLSMKMHSYARIEVNEFFDQVEHSRSVFRGYHPFVIAIVDAHLEGRRYENLFGSHRARAGVAVVTTAQVADVIVPSDRIVAYFIYYLARYSLSFLSPDHQNYLDSRGCVFDRKVDKTDITLSMRAHALCDECRRELVNDDGRLSPRQFSALNTLFALAGRIAADGFEYNGRARIFVGSSSEGLTIARKLQELLSDEFSVVVWDQGTVFGLGESTLEALEAAVLEYHYGIFVFTPDDHLSTRGQTKPVARDNVLFELGIFVGKLGRRKSFVLHPGRHGIELPSDLNGISTASYDPNERNLAAALGAPVNRIRSAIYEES
jgi:hypothetical protein